MKDSYLRRYPLSHLVIATVIVLSLAPIPEIPHLPNISLLDKWVHFLMYGGTCLVIWWEYWRQHAKVNWRHALVGAVLLPTLMGGVLELMQEYLTSCRSGDVLDFLANSIGVGLGFLVGYLLVPFTIRRRL